MSEETNSALLNSQVACALITAMGMLVHDLHRIHFGEGGVYVQESYEKVINDYGIHWNAAIDTLGRR